MLPVSPKCASKTGLFLLPSSVVPQLAAAGKRSYTNDIVTAIEALYMCMLWPGDQAIECSLFDNKTKGQLKWVATYGCIPSLQNDPRKPVLHWQVKLSTPSIHRPFLPQGLDKHLPVLATNELKIHHWYNIIMLLQVLKDI